MVTVSQRRQHTVVGSLHHLLAALGVSVDLLDVTGASRVATVLQVAALILTAVVVLLTLLFGVAGGTVAGGVLFVARVVARESITVLALLVSLGVLSCDMSALKISINSEHPTTRYSVWG